MGPPAVTMSTRARFAVVEGANDQRGWAANGRVRKRVRPSPTLPSGPELTLAKADNRFVPVFVAATAACISSSRPTSVPSSRARISDATVIAVRRLVPAVNDYRVASQTVSIATNVDVLAT